MRRFAHITSTERRQDLHKASVYQFGYTRSNQQFINDLRSSITTRMLDRRASR